ncbi:MAG: hypothetical protein HKP27_10195 [Myxococcales bacterium]|nr:hypothetical protein [Myxococcales bacterium]
MRACVEARCHYIDLAELPEFLTAVARAAERAGAEDAGTLVVPGCSTSPSLIACLAQRFRGLAGLARVDAWLSIGTNNPSSPALLYGLLRPLGRELPDGERAYARLAWRSARDGTALCYGRYPFPRENEELDLGAGALPVRFFAGFDRSFVARLLWIASRVVNPLSDAKLRRWTRWGDRAAKLARPFGGRIGRLALEAFDASGECLAGIEVTAERDGLDVPAAPPVWLLQNIASSPVDGGGCVPFERRVAADAALAGLARLGCRVDTWERAR